MTEQQPASPFDPAPGSADTAAAAGVLGGEATLGGAAGQAGGTDQGGKRAAALSELVDEPAKVMRIGTMLKQLLEEVRSAPLDDAGRTRLAAIHERSVKELEDGLAPELVEELHRINLPFDRDSAPTDAELRVAQAQLVGWLEGLFHGIQAALAAQQMATQQLAARLQLRQLPPGTVLAPGVVVGEDGEPRRTLPERPAQEPGTDSHGPGQYL